MSNRTKTSGDNLNWHVVMPRKYKGSWAWQQGRDYFTCVDMFDMLMKTADATWPGLGTLVRTSDNMTCCGGRRWIGPELLSPESQQAFWKFMKQAAVVAGLELEGKVEVFRETNCFKSHQDRGPLRAPLAQGAGEIAGVEAEQAWLM